MPVPSELAEKTVVPLTSYVIFDPSGVQSGFASSGDVLVTFRCALPFELMTNTSSLLALLGRVKASFVPSADQAGAPSGLAFLVRSALPEPSGAIEKMSSFFRVGSKRQAASLTYPIRPFAAWEPALADPPAMAATAPASTSTARIQRLRMGLSEVTKAPIGTRAFVV
jgi:hypothetical protein